MKFAQERKLWSYDSFLVQTSASIQIQGSRSAACRLQKDPPLKSPSLVGSHYDRAARGDYSSIPTLLGSRQYEPPRRATPIRDNPLPYQHRAARGDYSSIPTLLGSRQ
jgi:hypothetical protein